MRLHHDFNVLSERDEKPHQPFDGELPEISAEHLRHVGLPDTEKSSCFRLLEIAGFHQSVDLVDQLKP